MLIPAAFKLNCIIAAALLAPPSTSESTSVLVPTSSVTLELPEASRTYNDPPIIMLSAGNSINLTMSSPANEVLSTAS